MFGNWTCFQSDRNQQQNDIEERLLWLITAS